MPDLDTMVSLLFMQENVIGSVLMGRDFSFLISLGGGKLIYYQFPELFGEGIILVV